MVLSELVAIHQDHPEYGTERARRLLSEGERCSYGKAYRLRKSTDCCVGVIESGTI